MHSIQDTIKARRTVHQFTAERVDDSLIVNAIDTACWAPNHHLTEPWRFVLIGSQTRAKVLEVCEAVLSERQGERPAQAKIARWSKITGWLFLSYLRDPDPIRDQENYAASCCAAQNLQLALWEQEVGVKWTTGPVTRDQRLFEVLEIDPERHGSVGMFWYGRPAEIGTQKRQALDMVLRQTP